MVIATKDKYIKYLSPSHSGKRHDYRLLKQLFNPQVHWFEKYHILVDLGYLGFDKDYQTKELSLPHKRQKGGELAEEQQNDNKLIASNRSWVENSIGGMKRYRVRLNQVRIHLIDLYDLILGVCAGLWNFYLDN